MQYCLVQGKFTLDLRQKAEKRYEGRLNVEYAALNCSISISVTCITQAGYQ